ncbi:MAG: dehydrogenase [Bacteroidetes bacterium]|nr:dehydrogenase [Bacteroidota bacterium]
MPAQTNNSSLTYNRGQLDDELLRYLYRALLKPRMIEDKMLVLLRQGKISKWFSGIGQEAISVGATAALLPEELIFTMHRNLGVFTTRSIPLERLFCQWQGKAPGFTKGRDRSFHFGAMEYNIVGMISHLGPQLSLAGGAALGYKLQQEKHVSLAFTGDGATSQGEFHEAMNVAAVWKLPVIFVIENNGYGLSTPVNEQYCCENLADRGIGYGMRSVIINGNDVLEVYNTIRTLAKEIRENPHPVMVECKTFRMRGHEEASGVKYVPENLLIYWGEKDPLSNYEQFLLEEGILKKEEKKRIRKEIKSEIEKGLATAFREPEVQSSIEAEKRDVFAPHAQNITPPVSYHRIEKRFVDAVSDGLRLAMQKHPKLILMGQDIADYGGVFKVTDGFMEEFGKDRVRNTPLCESAIVGVSIGLCLRGFKTMMEMQFADFVTCGFNQIINNVAKLHYRWEQNVDIVIRMPTGGGVGAGPFHSQNNEAWFFHTPGLKVVYPSTPYDAKALLLASFEDPNPVLFFEHKALYRSIKEKIPPDYYTIEIGKAKVVQEGEDISVITYGMGVHWAKQVVKEMNINAEILDLRTLSPLDFPAIDASARKTGKVIILHEDTLLGGIGGEIAAYISEHLFEYLDGPVLRAASLDTPVPFAKGLENQFLPLDRFKKQLDRLLKY